MILALPMGGVWLWGVHIYGGYIDLWGVHRYEGYMASGKGMLWGYHSQ